ncbi:Phospholipase B1, membrane-associated [Lamellibrachia satsuma]|nr:Phospholipase B1, membrane-associated [Lamellibrachia satsuma]
MMMSSEEKKKNKMMMMMVMMMMMMMMMMNTESTLKDIEMLLFTPRKRCSCELDDGRVRCNRRRRSRMDGTKQLLLLLLVVYYQDASGLNNYERKWMDGVRSVRAWLAKRSAEAQPSTLSDELLHIPFNCTVKTSPNGSPKTVHELRPSDVNVVAAMGDSVTAGYGLGADNVLEVLVQNRGESWSIGGDKTLDNGILTLTNIIRKFNPKVKGFSTGATLIAQEDAGLNVAIGGHQASDMPPDANELIHKLLRSSEEGKIDYKSDWKLTTILIGGNDMCDYCKDRHKRSPEQYAENIMQALDLLQKNVPRMLVQIVVMFDVSPLRFLQDGFLCGILQERMCECALNSGTRQELRPLQLQYYQALKQLIEESGRYDTKDDFTVVLQPFMRDMRLPRNSQGHVDRSYFAPDCFHPGRKMHHAMAYMLWNNMLIPVGEKPMKYDFKNNLHFACPTKDAPYIYTNKNSNQK